jgi:hypothetical protein
MMFLSRIPDPGSGSRGKNTLEPGSGSVTLRKKQQGGKTTVLCQNEIFSPNLLFLIGSIARLNHNLKISRIHIPKGGRRSRFGSAQENDTNLEL